MEPKFVPSEYDWDRRDIDQRYPNDNLSTGKQLADPQEHREIDSLVCGEQKSDWIFKEVGLGKLIEP